MSDASVELRLEHEAVGPGSMVCHAVVDEELGALFHATVRIDSHDPALPLAALVGRPAALYARFDLGQARSWRGVVVGAEQLRAEATGQSTYVLRLAPRAWLLGRKLQSRIFQDESAPGIAERVLWDWGIEARLRLRDAPYPKLSYKVQYEESDLAFLTRILEEAGVTLRFAASAEDGRVEDPSFEDAVHAGEPTGRGPLVHVERPGPADRRYVTRLLVDRTVAAARRVHVDHDFMRPAYPLRASVEAPTRSELETRLEHVRYRPGAMILGGARGDGHHVGFGEHLARVEQASERGASGGVSFLTDLMDVAPGSILTVDGHPHAQLEGGKRLLAVRTRWEAGNAVRPSVDVRAVSAETPYRPPQRTPRPRINGLQTARVVGPPGDEFQIDDRGRVRVQFPWDRKGHGREDASRWIRVSQAWAGAGFGACAWPRVGQEVLIAYSESDPDQPIVVGRVYNAREAVPFPLPDGQTKSTWRSDSTDRVQGNNHLTLEDSAGEELVSLRAQRNLRRLVAHDEVATVVADRSTDVTSNFVARAERDRSQATGGARAEETGVNRGVATNLDQRELVRGDREEAVAASHLRDLKASMHVVLERERYEELHSHRHLRVGGSRNEAVGGDSIATGSYQVLVGGPPATGDAAIEAKGEIHLLAGPRLVVEGLSTATAKAPASFIEIVGGVVTIRGPHVWINDEGSPESGKGAHPGGPEAPIKAKAAPPVTSLGSMLEIVDQLTGKVIQSTQSILVGEKVSLLVPRQPGGDPDRGALVRE